jgi:hypothetical protein
MDWRDNGYNYDSNNNPTGYNGKPICRSAGTGILTKLTIVCFFIYGSKSIFETMPKKLAEGLDFIFQFLLAVIVFIVAVKILRWIFKSS